MSPMLPVLASVVMWGQAEIRAVDPIAIREVGKQCYVTTHGVRVNVDKTMKCPSPEAIEQVETNLIKRLGIHPSSFWDVHVTFTRNEIKCGGIEAKGRILGCSDNQGHTVVMSNQTSRGIYTTYSHELLHHFFHRMSDNGDGLHTARKIWDAAEDLDGKTLQVSFNDIAQEIVRLAVGTE